jgi:hypothetical protein
MRCMGKPSSDESSAARTRSRDSAHGGVGEPDHVVRGQARRHVDLDGDGLPVDPDERGTADRGEHGEPPRRHSFSTGYTSEEVAASLAPGCDSNDERLAC